MEKNESVTIRVKLIAYGGSKHFHVPAHVCRQHNLETAVDYEVTFKLADDTEATP